MSENPYKLSVWWSMQGLIIFAVFFTYAIFVNDIFLVYIGLILCIVHSLAAVWTWPRKEGAK